MSTKKRNPKGDFFEEMHQSAIEDGAIELGPVSPYQGGFFERIRSRITPGEVMKSTFDQALLKRALMDHYAQSLPTKVGGEIFERDIQRIKNFTFEERKNFDREVLFARMERRTSEGGIGVDLERAAGFGPEVFGFAYHIPTGRWAITNEMGLHAGVARFLSEDISFENGEERIYISDMISGFIFKLPSIETPIMTPFGFINLNESDLQRALVEIWEWKLFITIFEEEIKPHEYMWGKLFTPESSGEILNCLK